MKKVLALICIIPALVLAQSQTFLQPSTFQTNVYLHDNTNALHTRITTIRAQSLVITNVYTGGVMRLMSSNGTNFFWGSGAE